MAIVRDGRNLMTGLLVGDGNTDLSSDNAYIWVGSGVTAHDPTDAHLATTGIGSSQESGYPITATNVLTFRSTFATDEAYFQWEEWGIKNTSTTGSSLFNRKVESLGTKTSTQTWQMTVTLTITT